MLKRKNPAHYEKFFDLAVKEGLTYPAGRALYACNRKRCGGLRWGYDDLWSPFFSMQHARESTAKRWLEHWTYGGSIRSLQHTQVEWNSQRRRLDKEYRERQRVK